MEPNPNPNPNNLSCPIPDFKSILRDTVDTSLPHARGRHLPHGEANSYRLSTLYAFSFLDLWVRGLRRIRSRIRGGGVCCATCCTGSGALLRYW